MKLKSISKYTSAILIASTFLFLGCSSGSSSGDGSGGDSGGTDNSNITGNAVEGYLSGATVCYDLNNNLVCDNGEPTETTGTDGSFTLTVTPAQEASANALASLLVSGGTDIDTKLPFVGVLRAPYDNTSTINVTPLTTMASAIVTNGGSIDDAYQQVADALGLDVGLVAADPVATATTNPEIIQAAMTVQRIVEVMAAATVADDNTTGTNEAVNHVYEALANAIAEVADNNGTSGMAAIVTAAANETNSTLTTAAQSAAAVASIIEEQVSDAILDGGYNPDDALVIDAAVDVIENAVVALVENEIPIDTTVLETAADTAAAAANPILTAVENLLKVYSITADINQSAAIANSGYTESSEVTIASVSALIISDTLGTQAIIDALAAAYKTEQVEAYITNLEESVSDTTIAVVAELEEFSSTMTKEAFSALIYATGNAELVNLALTISPPEGVASLSDVEQAKALFEELRTQAMSVVDYDLSGTPGYLDDEAVEMNTALNEVVIDAGYVSNMFNFMLDGIEYAEDTNRSTVDTTFEGGARYIVLTKSGDSWSYDINTTTATDTWSGTLTYPDPENVDISSFSTLSVTIDGTLPLGYAWDTVASGLDDLQTFSGSVSVTKTSTGATIAIGGTLASNGDEIALSNMSAEIAYTTDSSGEPIPEYFKLNEITVTGTVGGYDIDGSFVVNSYVQNEKLSEYGFEEEVPYSWFSVSTFCENGTLSGATNSLTYTITDDVYTSSDFQVNSNNAWYSFENIPYWTNNTGSDILTTSNFSGRTNITGFSGTCSDGGALQVQVQSASTWYDYEIYNSGYIPNEITFTGSIVNTVTSGAISGTVNAKWLNAVTFDFDAVDATPLVEVSIDGKLQIPSRPEMLVHLGYKNSTTQNIINATYTYDTTAITVDGTFDLDMANGDIDITSATGIKADIEIVNSAIVYPHSNVTKDGLVLGDFEDRAGVPVIKYIDGTFESLP